MRKIVSFLFVITCFSAFSQSAVNKMFVGSAYYPNNLSKLQIEEDAKLMKIVDEFVATNIVKQALKTSGISSVASSTNELVEVTEVAGKTGNYLYAINYSDKDQSIQLSKSMIDVLTQEKFAVSAIIKARDYRVLNIK